VSTDQPGRRDPMIEDVLAELRSRLAWAPGRADLLAEVRDGLTDAADWYRRAGWSAAQAETRAVADFGDLQPVVAAYADRDVARSARWTALALGPGYLVCLSGWLVATRLAGSTADPGTGIDGWVFGLLGLVAVLVAAGGMFAVRGPVGGRTGSTLLRARLLALGSLGCAVTTLATSYLSSPWTLPRGWPLTAIDAAEVVSIFVVLGMLLTACWSLTCSARAGRTVQLNAASSGR
jgi:hypothetical protein